MSKLLGIRYSSKNVCRSDERGCRESIPEIPLGTLELFPEELVQLGHWEAQSTTLDGGVNVC